MASLTSRHPALNESGTRLRPGRVLVVDDEPYVGEAIAMVLSEAHAVTVVTSGEEAVARVLRGERYDVILCDVMMPRMSGKDVYERLRVEAPAEVSRLVFMTGCGLHPGVYDFLESIPNAWIEKPFEIDPLRAFVERRVRSVSQEARELAGRG